MTTESTAVALPVLLYEPYARFPRKNFQGCCNGFLKTSRTERKMSNKPVGDWFARC